MRLVEHRQHVSPRVSGQYALARTQDRRLFSLFTVQSVTRGAVELNWCAEIFSRFPAVSLSISVAELGVGEQGSGFFIGLEVQSTGQVKRVVKSECAGITPLPLPVPGEDGELGMVGWGSIEPRHGGSDAGILRSVRVQIRVALGAKLVIDSFQIGVVPSMIAVTLRASRYLGGNLRLMMSRPRVTCNTSRIARMTRTFTGQPLER
jgi:hypothetical protein